MLLRRIHRVHELVSSIVLWRSIGSTTSRPVLPGGSTLHRINEYFTPLVESDPEFNKVALGASVLARGLMKLDSEKILDAICWFNADICPDNRPSAFSFFRRVRVDSV
ncbi:unnamed protein product [Rodentolepis nana]|uniref:Cyclin N-terminal domain-containing protein n=1 Tax=Rodentolepis nana TaxID=102285 RepID=A0A0R3T3H2_RODNA|nr:unnamed protein product [Rodentolepis nana]